MVSPSAGTQGRAEQDGDGLAAAQAAVPVDGHDAVRAPHHRGDEWRGPADGESGRAGLETLDQPRPADGALREDADDLALVEQASCLAVGDGARPAVDRHVPHRPHQPSGQTALEHRQLAHEPHESPALTGGVADEREVDEAGVVARDHGGSGRRQVLRAAHRDAQPEQPEDAGDHPLHGAVRPVGALGWGTSPGSADVSWAHVKDSSPTRPEMVTRVQAVVASSRCGWSGRSRRPPVDGSGSRGSGCRRSGRRSPGCRAP